MDERLAGISHGISIKQPWAWLIAAGYKGIENRSRHFNYRGAIAIHASKVPVIKRDQDYALDLFLAEAMRKGEDPDIGDFSDALYGEANLGAIIGTATIVGCLHDSTSRWFEGPHGLVMNNPVLFDEPIPWRGQLGIWTIKET